MFEFEDVTVRNAMIESALGNSRCVCAFLLCTSKYDVPATELSPTWSFPDRAVRECVGELYGRISKHLSHVSGAPKISYNWSEICGTTSYAMTLFVNHLHKERNEWLPPFAQLPVIANEVLPRIAEHSGLPYPVLEPTI